MSDANYMDRFLDWLESTTPEERLSNPRTAPCPLCGHKAHPGTPLECQWCPEGYCTGIGELRMRDIDLDGPDGWLSGHLDAALRDAVMAAVMPTTLETTRLLSDGETTAVIAPCSYPEGIYPPRAHLVVIVPVDEPGTICAAYGGTMPDGRVRICSKDRWHGDSHTYEFGLTADVERRRLLRCAPLQQSASGVR